MGKDSFDHPVAFHQLLAFFAFFLRMPLNLKFAGLLVDVEAPSYRNQGDGNHPLLPPSRTLLGSCPLFQLESWGGFCVDPYRPSRFDG